MMNELYLKYAEVPKDAQSQIKGGRLNGMTNINPQWRIEALTELFGMCGQGWYYTIENVNETVADSEIVISVMINLYVKYDDEWSKAITGVGGSKVATVESKGLYVNDEALKMAVTDALSVACKQIGIASNIYRGKENNKYSDQKKQNFNDEMSEKLTEQQVELLREYIVEKGSSVEYIEDYYNKSLSDFTKGDYAKLVNWLKRR